MSKNNKLGMLVGCMSLVMASSAFASTVTVDGIMSAGEYTGANSGTNSLLWFNGHNSIYTPAAGNMNDLHWEINDDAGSYSLNIFFEVPTYARRMIWAKGCEYIQGGSADSDCDVLAPGGNSAYLEAYADGSHHDKSGKPSVKMDYKTQTESEFFQLNGVSGIGGNVIKWQDEDGTDDDFTWATSREYLLNEGICTVDLCLEFDRAASIEMMWLGLGSEQDALDILGSINDMELHLSDEARGLPAVVPVPAAAWLFGSGLLGLVGVARRRTMS